MSIVVTIDAGDLERVGKRFLHASRAIPEMLERGLDVVAERRKQEISDAAPRQTRPDARYQEQLYRSFDIVREAGMRSIVTRQPEKLYYVTHGTNPHVIKPRNKKALFWPGIRGGRPVAMVHHPGYRGNDFINRATSAAGATGGGGSGIQKMATEMAQAIAAVTASVAVGVSVVAGAAGWALDSLMKWANDKESDR